VANAVAYGKRIRLYPLSQAKRPPATTFIDVVDIVYDSTIPYDPRFFQSLDRIVQAEHWLERDKAMIDPLKSIGIEKGKPFNPDPRTQQLLNDAATEARAWLAARYESSFSSRYYEGRHWARPGSRALLEGQATFFAKPDVYPIDDRGVTYSYAYFSPKHLDASSARSTDAHGWIGIETVTTRFGDFEFKNGYPTAKATEKLYEFRTFNRAVESYLHCVTLMSMFYMQRSLNELGLDEANKFVIFESLLDAQKPVAKRTCGANH
jgi:hypothetical protein